MGGGKGPRKDRMLSKVHPVSVALRLEMLADSPLAFPRDWTVGRDQLVRG